MATVHYITAVPNQHSKLSRDNIKIILLKCNTNLPQQKQIRVTNANHIHCIQYQHNAECNVVKK